MIPAFGMVISPQNPSTKNGHVPGWTCTLSVGTKQLPRVLSAWNSFLKTVSVFGSQNTFCSPEFLSPADCVHPVDVHQRAASLSLQAVRALREDRSRVLRACAIKSGKPECRHISHDRASRKLILAGYVFGLSRQCLIMDTLWGFIYEALPGQFPK